MAATTKGATSQRTDPSWWDRLLLSVMGPPQIGENKPPEGYVPDPAAELCHKCGQPWTQHERVHTGTMTYRRCPPSSTS
jgi:hypothetical protein